MAGESSTSQRAAQVDEQTKQRSGCPTTHPEFDRLVRTIWRLRQPDGCPWDKEQTHRSLVKNMIEEAYEAVDAIEANDKAHLREELGDVLEQVLLHAQIEADATLSGVERKSFDIDDICRELNDKLIRRHPHVFHSNTASSSASTSDQVLEIWDEVKAEERKEKGMNSDAEPGLLDSVPTSLPALMQCQKISDRVAKVGLTGTALRRHGIRSLRSVLSMRQKNLVRLKRLWSLVTYFLLLSMLRASKGLMPRLP